MADPDDEDEQDVVADLVKDAIIARADAVNIVGSGQFFRLTRPGFTRECVDLPPDS